MSTEPDFAAEMRLPAGMACSDCVNGPRCDALFGAVRRGFTSCDFYPSRFVQATVWVTGHARQETREGVNK